MPGVPEGRAVDRPAAGTLRRVRRTLPPGLALGAVVVAAVAVFSAGGSDARGLVWVGAFAIVLAALGATAAALRLVPVPRPGAAGLALLAALAGYAAWSGATIAWSIAPDRSWESVNRALVYLSLLAVGMVAGSLVRAPPRAAAAALAGLLGFAAFWSLLGKVVPALGADVDRSARLVGPLDYWNALALAVALSLPLWLWFASDLAHRPLVRAAAVAALSWSVVTLLLTGSRGGLLVSAVAVVAWLALAPRRVESAAALALAVPVGSAVGVWALTRPGLVEAGAAAGDRTRDGALLGLVLVLAVAAVLAAALALVRFEQMSPLEAPRRRQLERAAAFAGVSFAVVVLALLVVRAGGPDGIVEGFRNPPEEQVPNDPSRYWEVASNNRWTWWTEAWEIFDGHPLRGTGAGSFEVARRPIRDDAQAPLDPHNLPLKALSETGLVGLLLVLGLVASGVWLVVAALRRLSGGERDAAVALAAGAAAWLLHALLDMTWELAAVTAPVLLALGVLSVSGRPRTLAAGRRPLAAVAAPALAAAVVLSLASPRLAERRLDDALASLELGRPSAAIEFARDAQDLNPLALEPLHMEAVAFEAAGRLDAAEALYLRAAELQPQNSVAWYELGRFYYESRADLRRALAYLDRAWALDPWAGDTGRLLDAVREEIERTTS